MPSLFSRIIDGLASGDPAYANRKLQLNLADKEAERQKAHDERSAAAEERRLRTITDEATRREKLAQQMQHEEQRDALVHDMIGQSSPVTGQPITPGEAFQLAESKLAGLKALQAVALPTSLSKRAIAGADLATEGDTAALPYEANRRITGSQADIVGNYAKQQDAEESAIRSAARRPYLADLESASMLGDTAIARAKGAEATGREDTAKGILPFLRSISALTGATKKAGLAYDLSSMPAEQELSDAQRAEKKAQAELFTKNPESAIKGYAPAQIRAQNALELQREKLGGLPGTGSTVPQTGGLSREDLMKRAAERKAAATRPPMPRSLYNLIDEAVTPAQIY